MKYVEEELLKALKEKFKDDIEEIESFRGEVSITVSKGALKRVMAFLRYDERFKMDMLVDLTAVDYPERNPRMNPGCLPPPLHLPKAQPQDQVLGRER